VKKRNSTFCGGSPTWTNACVGNNGSPSYVEYAKGFSKAANLIIDQVLASRDHNYSVDDMVYPVCFNMRHSVELRLKGAIEELRIIANWKKIKLEFDLFGSHDIGNIWSFFKAKSEKIDIRYKANNDKIEPIILDIAAVDASGQTFRYPIDNESQRHLSDVGLINFNVLKAKFATLEKELDNLLLLTEHLIDEYSLKTFTKNLSRQQLFFLAEELPKYSSWKDGCFEKTKQALRKKYALSNNELTKAINLIKSNYELMFKIECRLPLKGLDEYHLLWFLDFWMALNPEILNHKRKLGLFEIDTDSIFESWQRDDEIKRKLWSNLDGYLTAESLAGLNALFYFAPDKRFSETYILRYETELLESEALIKDGVGGVWDSFMHIADKTNFFENLVMSLFFLNYDALAEELIDIYGVSDAFSWLDKARSRELFMLTE
jgi:hypothetical protein